MTFTPYYLGSYRVALQHTRVHEGSATTFFEISSFNFKVTKNIFSTL